MKIYSNIRRPFRPITAADDDELSEDMTLDGIDDADVSNTIEDMADNIEDMRDNIEDSMVEDDPVIDVDNNIENHYIAECDICHGIFISAVVESDQDVQSITGVCPLCGKESDQNLNWVVKAR